MKAFKIYLIPLTIILGSINVNAQDEIYSNSNESENTVIINNNDVDINESEYYTESDYNNEVRPLDENEVEIFSNEERLISNEDEIYDDYDEEVHEKRRNGGGGEIAAEIIVEVVYNAIFFLAWWLQ